MNKEQEERYDWRADYEKAFGITESEHMWKRVAHKHLLEIIERDDVEIISFNRDENSGGDRRFITLRLGDYGITFHGHGWHIHRERYIVNEWGYYHISKWEFDCDHWYPPSSKERALKYLAIEHQTYLEKVEKQKGEERSEAAKIFSVIADLTDDDAALREMEDAGLI